MSGGVPYALTKVASGLAIAMLTISAPAAERTGPSLLDATDRSWPVTRAEPQTVRLTRYRSFPELAHDLMFGQQGFFHVTLVQYSSSKSVSSTERDAVTTGNSLTFKVDKSKALTNITSGSGFKFDLPFAASWDSKALSGSRAGLSRESEVSISAYSASEGAATGSRPLVDARIPSAERLSRAFDRGKFIGQGLSGLFYVLEDYCGYRGFIDFSAYRTLSKLAKASFDEPLKSANVFAKYDTSGAIKQVVYCTPFAGGGTCEIEGILNGWMPFTVIYDHKFLCETDRILEQSEIFLRTHIESETTSSAKIVNEARGEEK